MVAYYKAIAYKWCTRKQNAVTHGSAIPYELLINKRFIMFSFFLIQLILKKKNVREHAFDCSNYKISFQYPSI